MISQAAGLSSVWRRQPRMESDEKHHRSLRSAAVAALICKDRN